MNGRLLITCPDRHGIVAAVAGFLADSGANIITSDQHSTDPEGGEFFMRMEFTLEHGDFDALGRAFAQEVGERLDMEWRLTDADTPKQMAILVSREDHCLVDLLWRHRRGELDAEIPSSPPTTLTIRPTSRASASRTTTCRTRTSPSCWSCCAAATSSCSPATCGS